MSPFQLRVFFLIYKITHGMQLVLSSANGCGATRCSMGNLLEAISSEKWPSLSQKPAAAGSSSVRGGPHQPLPIHAGIWLDLSRSFEGSHTCCELTSTRVQSLCRCVVSWRQHLRAFLSIHPLTPAFFAPTVSCGSLSLGAGGAIKVSHLRLNTQS